MVEFAAKTENEILTDFFYNWNDFAAKTENEDLSELFLIWNESAAKTEKNIVSIKLVQLEVICG